MLTHEEEQALAEIFSEAVLQEDFENWTLAMEAEFGGMDAPAFESPC